MQTTPSVPKPQQLLPWPEHAKFASIDTDLFYVWAIIVPQLDNQLGLLQTEDQQ